MLTAKQKELLLFIHQRIKATGVSPSFDEMKQALNLRSKSGIHRLITALEERGFIRRLPHRARALEILKLPDSTPQIVESAQAPPKKGGFLPSVIEGSLGKVHMTSNVSADNDYDNTVSVPMMGRIAAGVPIAAIQNRSHNLEIPSDIMSHGVHFALEVTGDSMVNAGIIDGDIVIIQKCDTADNGDIVVALVDDEEATLKKLRRKGQSIALEAANPDYETRIFGPDRVKVQGRLVGLMRKY
ncbi:MAG: transcriptional repressor LexA [Pseudomonadota bacterium]